MADRASAIILSKRHILLIHRIRAEREFFVFPGGKIETGESAAEACVREVLEETGLHVAWIEPAFDYATPEQMGHYFFIQVEPGTLAFSGPEIEKQSGQNRYVLEWQPLSALSTLPLQPAAVRDAIASVITEHAPVREAQDLALRRDRIIAILSGSRPASYPAAG